MKVWIKIRICPTEVDSRVKNYMMIMIQMMIQGKKLNFFRKTRNLNKCRNKMQFQLLKYHNQNYLAIHTYQVLNYQNKKKIKIQNLVNKAKTRRMMIYIKITTK